MDYLKAKSNRKFYVYKREGVATAETSEKLITLR